MIEDVVLQIAVPFSRSLGPYDHVMQSCQGVNLWCDPPPLAFAMSIHRCLSSPYTYTLPCYANVRSIASLARLLHRDGYVRVLIC